MIEAYSPAHKQQVLELWNISAVPQGYVPLDEKRFDEIFSQNSYFSPKHSFVYVEKGKAKGFVCGCTGDDLPGGGERGYYSCLLAENMNDSPLLNRLLAELEKSFAASGKTVSDVLFFNPIRLPWQIPGTSGHEHNNAPGIALDSPLYKLFTASGYEDRAHEVAMYLNLEGFLLPEHVIEKQARLREQGFDVCPYDKEKHSGLGEMLKELESSEWEKEISKAADDGLLFLVATSQNRCAGFAGPIYPQPSGRGYFAGIGVAPSYEGNGLGSQLFFQLCRWEKKQGAGYMSLFTGVNNHAKKIYSRAGFKEVKTFALLRKKIG